MAFPWLRNDGPTLNAGLVALLFFRGSWPVLLSVCDFLGGGGGWGPDPLPPLDPRMQVNDVVWTSMWFHFISSHQRPYVVVLTFCLNMVFHPITLCNCNMKNVAPTILSVRSVVYPCRLQWAALKETCSCICKQLRIFVVRCCQVWNYIQYFKNISN